jgi:hypothetical protein
MHRILILASAAAYTVAAQSAASIQGSVVNDSKKAVAGAFVSATRTSIPPLRISAKTGGDGSFTITPLPGGTYTLCVEVPGDGYLNSCDWGAPGNTVTVSTGQASTGNTLNVVSGSVLVVRVDDALQLIDKPIATGVLPHLAIGVSGGAGKMFYPAHRATKDSTGSTYQVTVPLNAALALSVHSRNLQLADSGNNALPGNASVSPFQNNSGDASQKSFRFAVTGVKQ